jgi:hypothetical protein
MISDTCNEPATTDLPKRGFLSASKNTLDLALFLIGLLPAVLIVRLISQYGVSVPFGDDWSLVPLFAKWFDHKLTFADLFQQHNEHRVFFPKLIYLAFAQFTHWNIRAEMFFSVFLCAVTSACTYVLLRQSVPGSRRKHLFLWAIINLLIFSPAQAGNWFWGFQLQIFIPNVCLTAALVVLGSKLTPTVKLSAAAALAIVASFSFGNGLLLWPALAVCLWFRPQTRLWSVGWLIIGATVGIVYFAGYEPHPPAGLQSGNRLDYVTYFLRFIGNALGQLPIHNRAHAATLIGATALLLYFVGLALFIPRSGRTQEAAAPLLVMGLYSLGSAAIASYTRIHSGVQQALSSRYSSISLNLFIGLIGLAAIAPSYLSKLNVREGVFRCATLLEKTILAGLVIWYATVFPEYLMRIENLFELRLVQMADLHVCKMFGPSSSLQSQLEVPGEFAGFVHKLAILDRLHLVDPPMRESRVLLDGENKADRTTCEFGRCDVVIRSGDDNLEMSGWCFLPSTDRPAPCVVLGYQSGNKWLAAALAEVYQERPDLAKARGGRYRWAGWRARISLANIPPAAERFSAWAVDPVIPAVLKLPGDFVLPKG